MRVSLTDRFCAGVKAKGQIDYFDEQTSGLALRVTGNGVKAWTLVFSSPRDGKRARLTLGRYPQTTPAQARTRALEAKGHLDQGNDPRDVQTGAMTVGALVPLYIEKPHRKTGKPRRGVKSIKRRLEANVVPTIGGEKLSDLHRRDAQRVVTPIMRRNAPGEAIRVFEDLRAMIRWGLSQGYLDRNPFEGMEPPAKSIPRERVLTNEEIKTLWTGLPTTLPAFEWIIKLCLVTAQRVGEVAGMLPNELDLERAVWTIPGSRTKNGYEHSVPLSPLAIEIIKGATLKPLPSIKVSVAIAKKHGQFGIPHFTAHDLRRSALTGMAKLGVAPIVLGHVANHRTTTKAGITLGVYVQHAYEREKREALELWANRLQGIISGAADVVSIGNKR